MYILIGINMNAYDYRKEKFKARPQLEVYISDYLQKHTAGSGLRWHNATG